ncbi:MAG: peroxidase family protein [Rubripirellula sp.]
MHCKKRGDALSRHFSSAKSSAMTLTQLIRSSLRSFLQVQQRSDRQIRVGSTRQSKARRQARRLRGEALEVRRLLAADFDGFRHNVFDAEDVNDDGAVSAIDALMIINAMNRDESRESEMFTDVNNDGQRTSLDALRVINRMNRDGIGGNDSSPGGDSGNQAEVIPSLPDEIRSIDGVGNHLENPELGSTGEALRRVASADYGDGISTPAGADRPSAREISNRLSNVEGDGVKNERGLSVFVSVWGQFIDHDMDLSEPQGDDGESFGIVVPTGDPLFDPTASGEVTIPLIRSEFDESTGTSVDNPRQQVNRITAFLDGSQIYGSDQATAAGLRTFEGGRLAITDSGLLPLDSEGEVIAGDIRASENISLTAIQTLFVREHNRLAQEISVSGVDLSDEEIYQQARAIVIGQTQAITYNEFLPALLGNRAIGTYNGYDATVDPSIATEFSTAAFRFGHSTLNEGIEFFGNEGRSVREAIELKDAFFNASLLEETGIDALLKYDASSQAQEIDLEVVGSLRNFLFGSPGSGGFDLVALNIQRGRDHGLNDYNSTRVAYGLDSMESFDEITSNLELRWKLESLYGNVDNIDLWVGLMAEDHAHGASVGELTHAIVTDQFTRLRDGDRLFYENVFEGQELDAINSTSLADLIERNTTVEGLQDNVFFMLSEVRGTVTASSLIESAAMGSARFASRDSDFARAVEGVAVELLDDAGDVIDTTSTDWRGNYRFRSFAETGLYQVRLTGSMETLDVLIANGSERIRGLDFEVAEVSSLSSRSIAL